MFPTGWKNKPKKISKRRNFPLASVIFVAPINDGSCSIFKYATEQKKECGERKSYIIRRKSRLRKVSSLLYFSDFRGLGFGVKGFTLIELLIAVAITSILLTALYAAFFSIYRVTEVVEDKLERHLDRGGFLDRFVREVNAVYLKDTNQRTIFRGEKKGLTSSLSFTSFTYPVLKEGSPASDLMAVSYFVEDDKGEEILYRETVNPYNDEKSKLEVLKGIKGFEVGFFNGKDWVSAWDASLEKRLPDAVRVAVITGEGKEMAAIAVPRIK